MQIVKLIALIALLVTAYFLIAAPSWQSIIAFYQTLAPPMFAFWVAGYIIFLIAPLTLSILFWWRAKTSRHGWVLHILHIPVLAGISHACVALMTWAADEKDFDGPTSWATLPPMMILMVCILTYLVALAVKAVTGPGEPSQMSGGK